MQPHYRGRHRRPSRLHLLIAGPVVALALTLAGCGGAEMNEPTDAAQADQPAPQSTPEPEPSPDDDGQRTKSFEIGETAVYSENGADVAEITVSDVEVYGESKADPMMSEPPKNGGFVKFTVQVTYVGDGTAVYHVNPFNWSVKADGRVYDSQAIFEPMQSELPATDLVSDGGEVTGDVVMDAPDSGEIRLSPTMGGAKAFWAYGDGS